MKGLLLVALVVASGCRSSAVATAPEPGPVVAGAVTSGVWGATGARLTLTEQGGTLELDCAHGGLDQRLIVSSGRFDVPGFFVAEHGGPTRADETPDREPVRFTGEAANDVLVLRIVHSRTPRTDGPWDLRLGQPGRIVKCL